MLRRLFAVVVVFSGSALAAPLPAQPPQPASPSDRFSQGDALYRARGAPENARKALELYRALYAGNPEPAAAWRVSMACYFVGLRQTRARDERTALFDEGRKAGFAGAAASGSCAACHFWGAINLALYADAVGVFNTLFALGEIREHLKASLAVDAAYASGGAYRLLGLIEQKLPGILGGDDDRAREYFSKAIEVAPNEPLNYLFMAKLERDEFHDGKQSQRFIARGLAVPPPTLERLESIESLGELKQLAQAK